MTLFSFPFLIMKRQIDGTPQGPHMSCSYADIATADFDKEALEYHLSATT